MRINDNYPLYDRLIRWILDYLSIGKECIGNSNMNGMISAYASITTILNIIHSEFDDYMFSSKYKVIDSKVTLFTKRVNEILELNKTETTLSDWYNTINDKDRKDNFVFIMHIPFSDGEIAFESYPLKWENVPEELKSMKRSDFIPSNQDVLNNVFYIQIKKGGETHD